MHVQGSETPRNQEERKRFFVQRQKVIKSLRLFVVLFPLEIINERKFGKKLTEKKSLQNKRPHRYLSLRSSSDSSRLYNMEVVDISIYAQNNLPIITGENSTLSIQNTPDRRIDFESKREK